MNAYTLPWLVVEFSPVQVEPDSTAPRVTGCEETLPKALLLAQRMAQTLINLGRPWRTPGVLSRNQYATIYGGDTLGRAIDGYRSRGVPRELEHCVTPDMASYMARAVAR